MRVELRQAAGIAAEWVAGIVGIAELGPRIVVVERTAVAAELLYTVAAVAGRIAVDTAHLGIADIEDLRYFEDKHTPVEVAGQGKAASESRENSDDSWSQ